jgi:hypothetical protein
MVRLLLSVLKSSEALPLRQHLMAPSGRQHLITAAFALQPVSDTGAPASPSPPLLRSFNTTTGVSEACTCAGIIAARQQVADMSLLTHHGLQVLHVLVKRHPELLLHDSMVVGCLRHVFAKAYATPLPVSPNPSVLDAKAVRAQEDQRLLVKCLMHYCLLTAQAPQQLEVAVLLDLLVVFTRPAVVDFSFLRDFFRKEVTDSHTTQTLINPASS